MKLADIDVDALVRELGLERSAWLKLAQKENAIGQRPEASELSPPLAPVAEI